MRRTAEKLLSSYYELICSLLPGCLGVGIADGEFGDAGGRGDFDGSAFCAWLQAKHADIASSADLSCARMRRAGQFEIGLALVDSTRKLIAVVGVAVPLAAAKALGGNPGKALRQRLQPVLDCLHRELASAARAKSKVATLSERTRDLEWLFQIAGELKSAGSNAGALQHLISTAADRIKADFACLIVPGQHLLVQHAPSDALQANAYEQVRAKVQEHILSWAAKHRRPLIVNGAGSQGAKLPPCKLLAVPLLPAKGPVIGALLFVNSAAATPFLKRHGFLAADIARHAVQLLQSQYDLATGLLTRTALEQTFGLLPGAVKSAPQTVLHVDIDRLHVINNVQGFPAGDEVILRLAAFLAPPLIPRDALIARLAGDQFAIVLPNTRADRAVAVAVELQRQLTAAFSASAPDSQPPSLSGGVAEIVDSRLGLGPALVSAEAACRTAKEHGGNRIETYTCDDASVMRRFGDARKAWSLEDALESNRFELFAQSIVPLSNPELSSGYEVLLRLRNEDGSVDGPDSFLPAAQRYQMMPAIDRWVLDHTLSTVESYAGVLVRRGVKISWNLTGHSLGDAQFIDYLLKRVKSSRLPPGLMNIEITEQSAVRNLPAAVQLMKRLREVGCGVALDDFGTGTSSLTYLRDLPVSRVKIDGSFVRDIMTNRRAAATLKSIVELIRPYDVEIVAEYVENADVAAKARQLGIDYGQGYAFGKPRSLTLELEALKQDESRKLHRLALEI
ncbi:MAG: EAL domain-containing protein [Proteobacteria bacterium]|nr:EAL domain-containing protein [Pseudomonadota bacterium]